MIKKVKDAWYYLKCKYWYKYNTVTCKQIPPTWVDRDHLIEQAMFQVLSDFIEKESPGYCSYKSIGCPDTDEYMKEVIDNQNQDFINLCSVYNWYYDVYLPYCNDSIGEFKKKYPEKVKPKSISYEGYGEYENEMHDLVTEKLKLLIEHRGSMWT